jgi:5-methylcytosine-specific restriction endonuclease McrA
MITRAKILAKRTPNGGYTKTDLEIWGVPWPPPKGWIARLTGEEPVPDISNALRYEVLKRDKGCCVLCGRSAKDGVQITVDHILPKSVYRDRPVTADNLQTLCLPCNEGKGATDQTDWRAA